MPHDIPKKIAELINQMPEVDRPGQASKFTGPDPAVAQKIYDQILGADEDGLAALIDLVREPVDENFDNYKAGYVLHGLVVHAGAPGRGKDRQLVSEMIASQLRNEKHSEATRAFLLRELQLLGDRAAIQAIAAQLLSEELCEPATQALLAIGEGAAEPIRNALKEAKGPRRRTLAQAAGVLRDPGAAPLLLEVLKEEDRDTRVVAAWSLAQIGDASSVDPLLAIAEKSEGWEKIQALKSCLLLAENLAKQGKNTLSEKIHQRLATLQGA
jgi:hypothetical protein